MSSAVFSPPRLGRVRMLMLMMFCVLATASFRSNAQELDGVWSADMMNYTQLQLAFSNDGWKCQVIPQQAGASFLVVKIRNANVSMLGREYGLDSVYCPKISVAGVESGWTQLVIPVNQDVDLNGVKWRIWDTLLTISLPLKKPNPLYPSMEQITAFKRTGGKVVVIDPGHGGFDPGGVGGIYTGPLSQRQREKDLTLDLATRLKKQLESDPQFMPILTRYGDYLPAPFDYKTEGNSRKSYKSEVLLNRVKMAKDFRGDIYVSLHLNSAVGSAQKRAEGFEIYYFGEDHAQSLYDNPNRDIEELETLGIDRSSEENALVAALKRDWIPVRSKELAASISNEMRGLVTFRSPYLKSNRYKVISQLNMPSVLVEYMFICNPREHEYLKTSKNRDRLAAATYKGIRNYFFVPGEQPDAPLDYDKLVQAAINASGDAQPSAAGDTTLTSIKPEPQVTAVEPVQIVKEHVVRTGESLTSIAQKYGITVDQLREVNRETLGPRDRIFAGKTKLAIPATSSGVPAVEEQPPARPSAPAGLVTYRVRSGDTLEKIAMRHNTSIDAIRNLNRINGSRIFPGQSLKITPGVRDSRVASALAAPTVAQAKKVDPIRYKVRRGDTLSEIAEKYGASTRTIRRYNGMKSSRIRAGQVITIPR
ncbi:MAG: LysM peptidoglycan-binding domain-containing protein [bacterium]|nr:LysM peptidoglycan-binding domain-containing protein [bacterium]